MNGFRFLLRSVFNKKWIIILTSDAHYVMGNQRLIATLHCMGCFIIIKICALIHVLEMSKKFTMLTFLRGYKYKLTPQLNASNTRSLNLKANLISRVLQLYVIWPMVVSAHGILVIMQILAYFDHDSGFLLSSIIFWSIPHFVYLVFLFYLSCFGTVAAIISTLYLKYRFQEINRKIELSLKLYSVVLLLNAITEHNTTSKQTKDLNDVWELIIFLIYYMTTPPLMVLLYLVHAKDIKYILRLVAGAGAFLFVLLLFSINLLSSMISGSAHKPRNVLYTFLMSVNISIAQKLKIINFIENLNGSVIGFYCWNLFPMTNHYYSLYVANCAATYLLVNDFMR